MKISTATEMINPRISPKPVQSHLTEQEKNYFAGLYPEKKDEIVNYHYYEKSGKMSGVKVGSLFDKRG